MHKGIEAILETVKTDRRLTALNSTGIYCLGNSWNSLENFACIQLIMEKFSREFIVYTAITWQNTVSLLSVLTVSKQTANALHIGVLSV